MLRALVLLLLLANGLFYLWSHGHLGHVLPPPHAGEREPGRLALQVKPESVRLLTPQAASAAVAAAAVCLETAPLPAAAASSTLAAVLAAGVAETQVERREQADTGTWLLYMGRFADAAALRTKAEELKRLKLGFEELRSGADAALLPGLVLSRHEDQASANAALAALQQRGVRTARVVALPPPPPLLSLRVAKATPELQRKLGEVKLADAAPAFTRCPRR